MRVDLSTKWGGRPIQGWQSTRSRCDCNSDGIRKSLNAVKQQRFVWSMEQDMAGIAIEARFLIS